MPDQWIERQRIRAVEAQARLFEALFLDAMGTQSAFVPVNDPQTARSFNESYCNREWCAQQVAAGQNPRVFQEHAAFSYSLDPACRRRIQFVTYPSADDLPVLVAARFAYSVGFTDAFPASLMARIRAADQAMDMRAHDSPFIGHPGYRRFIFADGRFDVPVYRPWAESLGRTDRLVREHLEVPSPR